MSEWAKVSLSEVARIIPGFAFKSKEFSQHGTPVVKIKDINPPLVNSSDLARIDEDAYPLGKLDKYRLHSGDFVVAMTGATIGKVGRYVSKERGLLNQRVAKISPIHSVSWDFIYHAVSMPYFDRFIENNIDSESAQANISASGIGRYPIALPKLKEQEAIAEVLSSLDDKIDLLKRQNKTLEGMAEALFRQWFIEEAQDDWGELPITHLIQLVGGGTPKTSVHEFWGGNIPWLAGGDITEHDMGIILKTEKWITKEGLEGSSAKLLPKWSTVISARGTVGKITMLGRSSAFSQSNYGIIPSDGQSFCFTFLLVANETKRLLNAAYGAVFDTITKRTFEGLTIPCPPSDVIHSFEEKVQPLFKRQQLNQEQISGLVSQRDTLLPKLMSGEVRVQMD